MNLQRIVLSLGMVVFAGALVAGATGAFFSDTETSTGNTFTAGEIDLTVDATAHYAGLICDGEVWVDDGTPGTTRPELLQTPCDGSWTLTDLGPNHKFFNLSDVKPGDEGENTISLHLDSNPAWVCADVDITENSDNGFTEPEDEVSLPNNDDDDGTPEGDLAANLMFVAWLDNASTSEATPGDNIHQAGEVFLFEPGPASNVLDGGTLALADSTTGNGPIPPLTTNYIGLAWCAGTMTADENSGAPTCDGESMGNIAQTDKMVADLTFRVEQSRNNEEFTCEPPVVPPPTNPIINEGGQD